MNIILLGPQGSGKGTQADLLSKNFHLLYFEGGRYLRELAKTDPRIDEIINKIGALVPGKEMFGYVKDFLSKKCPSLDGFLLEGFPRDIEQYQLIKNWLTENNAHLDYAIVLEIDEAETIKRLSARRTCDKCGEIYNLRTNPPPSENECRCGGKLIQREDDKPEAIKNRLTIYREQTQPLIDLLLSEKILIKIDGRQSIEDVYKNIVHNLPIQ